MKIENTLMEAQKKLHMNIIKIQFIITYNSNYENGN